MAEEAQKPPDRAERFESVYRSCRNDLLRYALRRTHHRDDAADVVAETFLVAWRRIGDLPRDDSHARPWLFGVARNVMANRHRTDHRHTRLAAKLRTELAHTAVQPPDAAYIDIGRVFRALPDSDREILGLVAWEQLTTQELAIALGRPANVVRVRLYRARKRFAAALRAAGLDDATPRTAMESTGKAANR